MSSRMSKLPVDWVHYQLQTILNCYALQTIFFVLRCQEFVLCDAMATMSMINDPPDEWPRGINSYRHYPIHDVYGAISGASFQLFLGGPNFFYFSMSPDYWKIGKNSTLYVAIWRYSYSSLLSFFLFLCFIFFCSFFFSFFLGGGGRRPPALLKWRPCAIWGKYRVV